MWIANASNGVIIVIYHPYGHYKIRIQESYKLHLLLHKYFCHILYGKVLSFLAKFCGFSGALPGFPEFCIFLHSMYFQ